MRPYRRVLMVSGLLMLVTLPFLCVSVAAPPTRVAAREDMHLDCRATQCSEEQLIEALCVMTGSVCFRSPVITETTPRPVVLTIEFDPGSASIVAQYHAELDKVARVLKLAALQDIRIRIIGHTDDMGHRDKNQNLSERRAASVREYFIARHEIAAERVEAVGMGERRSLESNETPAGRRMNRRVEITSLKP